MPSHVLFDKTNNDGKAKGGFLVFVESSFWKIHRTFSNKRPSLVPGWEQGA